MTVYENYALHLDLKTFEKKVVSFLIIPQSKILLMLKKKTNDEMKMKMKMKNEKWKMKNENENEMKWSEAEDIQ